MLGTFDADNTQVIQATLMTSRAIPMMLLVTRTTCHNVFKTVPRDVQGTMVLWEPSPVSVHAINAS